MSDSTLLSPVKQCNTCGNIYPATVEYFTSSKRHSFGVRGKCKACRNKQEQAYRDIHREQINARTIARRALNPEQYRNYHRQWRANNPDRVRARAEADKARYVINKSNPEYMERRRQKRVQRRKESGVPRKRRERGVNLGIDQATVSKISAHNRRAKAKGLAGTLTPQQWIHALGYFENSCAVCGRKFDGETCVAAIDHWIPLSAEGCQGTVARNIVPLCHSFKNGCNTTKRNKNPHNWLTGNYNAVEVAAIESRIEAYFVSLESKDDGGDQ